VTAPDRARIHRLAAYRAVRDGWEGRYLLACSGGVDSSALLALAAVARDRGDIPPFVVAYVDHRARAESAEEGGLVARLCQRFGVPITRVRVRDWELTREAPAEADLRERRYEQLARVARSLGLDGVATAHTRDDQVETVLMRLLSGAGGVGGAAMRAVSIIEADGLPLPIVRPLLEISRVELEKVVKALSIEPLHDPSNLDTRYRRNAIRREVVPVLNRVAPGWSTALLRSVTLARRDAELVDAIAAEHYRAHASATERRVEIERAFLRRAQPAIATRVIRLAILALVDGDAREVTFERIDSVRVAAEGRTGARIELPYGIVARIGRDAIVMERRGEGNDGH
jgi:tRNA(Ile)-lysidine synthetase-like protein